MRTSVKNSYPWRNVPVSIVLFVLFVIIAILTLVYSAPSILDKKRMQFVLQSVPSISIPAAQLLGYNPSSITNIESYHDPPPFCNRDTNIVYNNSFPDTLTIEQLIAKRSEPIENIPMCPNADVDNYNQYQHILSKLPSNLIAYTNRCQINAIGRGMRQFGGLLSGDPLRPNMSTQIGFLHVYKAGGTTVRDTMNKILPGLGRTTWHEYKGHIREFMSHLFMFSHVRDPVTRTISSYFELHRRNESDVVNNRLVGVDSFRYLLAMMGDRMDCSLGNKDKLHKMKDPTIGDIYFNMHIMPQMYFLTEAANPWKPWPVNYVGNMSELTQSMFEIFYHFFWNTTDYMNWWNASQPLNADKAHGIFSESYHHGRDRHQKHYINGGERRAQTKGDELLKYQIEADDLSDEDVNKICELYWMDYICIPFPVPKACNLTELLLKHYGDDVVYRDCWDYNTDEWDTLFVEKYIKGHSKQRIAMNRKEAMQLKREKIKRQHKGRGYLRDQTRRHMPWKHAH